MEETTEIPIEGQILVLTAAKASVPPKALPYLLRRVQADLGPRLDDYYQAFELVDEDSERATFLVSRDHWRTIGDRLGFDRRETDAVERAHTEQLRRVASRLDRRDEFETALEIRSAVVVGVK
ncbi:hypothetical protein [Halogranum rubrum]|uniref:DUF8048 domain-containing protein n=1 Tax=Halogranum salarium B-1 TaxID=1210908 RepID=J3JEM9_9EURY|nr:hypothetical protein [Halogranum salarium]EJN58499.1 hypothetical protein HSB1_29770 [Halogranum salarium B-1]